MRGIRCSECGYDIERRDATVAIAKLSDELRAANRMWLGGLMLLFLSPGLLFSALNFSLVLLGGVVGTGGGTLAGLGILRGDHAKRRLLRARERMQLPPARLV